MEIVNSNNKALSGNLSVSMMDISKNLAPKVDSSNVRFKDYVQPKNNPKYEPKRDNKTEYRPKTNNEPKNKLDNNDSKDNNVVNKEDPKPKVNDNKDTSKDENTNKNVDNNKSDTNTSQAKDSVNKKETEKPKVVEDVEEKDTTKEIPKELQNILMSLLVEKSDASVKNEPLADITPEMAKKLLEQIDEQAKELNIPEDLKKDLQTLLGQLSKGEKLDKSDFLNALQEKPIYTVEPEKTVTTNKNIEDNYNTQTKSEPKNETLDLNINLGQELKQLRNDLQYAQNNARNTQVDVEVTNTNDDISSNNVFTGESVGNIKMFGDTSKILGNIQRATPNNEQIQNFSKIVDEMRMAFKDDKTTINIKLEPQTLGKLSIKINSENGIFNASFFVESDKAKQAVENELQSLRQALTDQGVVVQDINVQVGQGNEDLNYHQNIMEAINFSKRGSDKYKDIDSEEFKKEINPYMTEDLFNDLI